MKKTNKIHSSISIPWNNKIYFIENKFLLTDLLVREYIYKFFEEEVKSLFSRLAVSNKKNHILILFRVLYTNNNIATIGPLKKLNIYDKIYNLSSSPSKTSVRSLSQIQENIDNYIEYINNLIKFKDDHYKNEEIKAIIFSFGIREGEISSNLEKQDFNSIPKVEVLKNNIQTFSNYKLPIAFEPYKYENVVKLGKYLYMVPLKDSYFIKIKYTNKNLTES